MELFNTAYFSQHLASAMAGRSWTQKDLAAASGLSQSTISRYLKSSTEPKISDVLALAHALGLHPMYLINPERFDEPFKIASAAAKMCEGTPEEKQAAFEKALKEPTAKIKQSSDDWDDLETSLKESVSTYNYVDWKGRALAAEKLIQKFRSLLNESSNQD